MAKNDASGEEKLAWKQVRAARDNLFNEVFKSLSEDERQILIALLELEAQQRAYSAPQIKKPLRSVVEGRIR